MNHCLIVFFVIFVLFSSLSLIEVVGIKLQEQYYNIESNPESQFKVSAMFIYIVVGLNIIYNIVACYYSY